MYIADLHIHSLYSRATSRDCDAPHLDIMARRKGIRLVGTGDFTHPAWRAHLRETLTPAEEGLYTLREEAALPEEDMPQCEPARFVISGEISSIYKKNGKTRKVHNVVLLPGLDAAEKLARKLTAIGNLHSDGRPILGLDSRDLLEITLDACPEAMLIPAHIWTPHFSLFGAFSGFDAIEECFEDLTCEIHALETGLSSDPPMNWRVSALDRFTLISNSDAHSPGKLGREANLLDTALSYPALRHAIQSGEGFAGTLEFFPEEGKYHLDGHRNCRTCLTPEETERFGGKCPVCGKKITIGVQHRAWELADRAEGYVPHDAKPFESLVPLPEVIGASLGVSGQGRQASLLYARMLQELGAELTILRKTQDTDIERVAGPLVAEGIRRLRAGKVGRIAGYDGEYGKITLFSPAEREELMGQMALFAIPGITQPCKKAARPASPRAHAAAAGRTKENPDRSNAPNAPETADALNPEQQAAVEAAERAVAVIAGPGTGKTKTLVARISHLIEARGVHPSRITAVTFTNQAAAEMRARLAKRLGGKRAIQGMTIGTFHAICLRLLGDGKPLLGEDEALRLLAGVLSEEGRTGGARQTLRRISRVKGGESHAHAGVDPAVYAAYCARCRELGVRDLDDLLLDALALAYENEPMFTHLLVDELQDIDAVQRALVRRWSENGASLFVIGDPDQSIYGFRGANARCFADLAGDFPAMRTITLKRNYRSTPEILHCAAEVIRKNPGGARLLEPVLPGGAAVRLIRADNAFSEAVWIAKEIARMAGGIDMLGAQRAGALERANTRPFSDIAVLCRTHRQLQGVEACLVHDGIPCIVSGREDFLEDDAVQEALAFFRSLINPACASGCPDRYLSEREEYRKIVVQETPRRLLERWTTVHGGGEPMVRLMDMAVFHRGMAEFLHTLALGEEADLQRASGKAYESGAVRLMTLHGAKGLEFPAVFLAGLSAGAFPLTRAAGDVDVEEERRLLFVGVTRAKEELILTAAEPLSDFVRELPDAIWHEAAALHRNDAGTRQLKLF